MNSNVLAAIVLNYNSSADTVRLYRQLVGIPVPNLLVLVVDNRSEDVDREFLIAHIPKRQLILLENNTGYAGGNNVGIRRALAAGAEYIWVLNPDIVIESSTLELLVGRASQETKLAAIGPRICVRNAPDRIFSDGGLLFPRRGFAVGHLHGGQYVDAIKHVPGELVRDVSYVDGSAILFRANALRSLGPLRECFFLYYEESEWCLRATDAGWTLAVYPEAVVYHTRSDRGPVFHFYMTRNRIWLAKLRGQYVRSAVRQSVRRLVLLARGRLGAVNFGTVFAGLRGLIAGVLGSCDAS